MRATSNTRCMALLEASTCAARVWAQPLEYRARTSSQDQTNPWRLVRPLMVPWRSRAVAVPSVTSRSKGSLLAPLPL